MHPQEQFVSWSQCFFNNIHVIWLECLCLHPNGHTCNKTSMLVCISQVQEVVLVQCTACVTQPHKDQLLADDKIISSSSSDRWRRSFIDVIAASSLMYQRLGVEEKGRPHSSRTKKHGCVIIVCFIVIIVLAYCELCMACAPLNTKWFLFHTLLSV